MWYFNIIAFAIIGTTVCADGQYAPQSSQAIAASAAAAKQDSYGPPLPSSAASYQVQSADASVADMSQYAAANNLYPAAATNGPYAAQVAPSAQDAYYTQNDGQYQTIGEDGGGGGDHQQNYANVQVRYTFIPTYIYRNRVIERPNNLINSIQTIENPSYDPNLYQTFVPQDSVQQYVNSYGGPYSPSGGGMIGVAPPSGGGGGGIPIINGGGGGGGPIGAGPYALGPYGFPGGPVGPAGFSVQSGFEGFLVPHIPPPPPPPPPPQAFYNGGGPGPFDLLRAVVPHSIASIFMRSGSYLLQTIGVILFGGAVTTAICSLTPLCTISFAALPLLGLRGTTKTVTDALVKEVTTDRVARAAAFVKNAIAKYQQLQLTHVESSGGDAREAVVAVDPIETTTAIVNKD